MVAEKEDDSTLYPNLSKEIQELTLENKPSNDLTATPSSNDNDKKSKNFPTSNPYELPPIEKNFETFIREYIRKIDEIHEKLYEMKLKAESQHQRSNYTKLSGTILSATGVAMVMGSVVGAPFTAGSTLLLGAGGAVMSVTGSLTNVVVDFVDYRTTSLIIEDLKLLSQEKNAFEIWMRRGISHFNTYVKQMEAEGISRDVAITTVTEGIAKGAIDILQEPNSKIMSTLTTAIKLHHIEHLAVETLPVIGKTFHMTEKSFQFIYNILGLSGRTLPTVMKEFAKISGILSVAFVVADVSLLIKDMMSEHPSVSSIEEGMKKLEEERNVLKDLLLILQTFGTEKGTFLEKILNDIKLQDDALEDNVLLNDFVIVNDDLKSF